MLFVLGVGAVGLAAPASAAKATTTTTKTKATTTTTAATATATNEKTWPWLSAAALGLGVVAAGAVLVFVRRESEATQTTERMAIERGLVTTTQPIAPFVTEQVVGEGTKPAVEGPSQVEIGKQYEYTAKVGADVKPATWRVDAPGFVELPEASVASLHVTPQKAGAFSLTAVVSRNASEPKQVTAVAPQPSSQASSIPFVGEGWGSIVVAMVVAALVTALGFVRVLNGEALAGFYGALIGYVFHKAASEKSNKGTTDSGKGPKGGADT